jgi:hypothetical protein
VSKALVLALALSGLGCAGPRDSVDETAQGTLAGRLGDPPDIQFGRQSGLGLINGRRLLQVGDPARGSEGFFEAPERSRELRDVPPGFEAKYRSRGWETASEGFGVLIYGDSIALAMRYYEHVQDEFFDELLDRYMRWFPKLAPVSSAARVARYWFVQSGNDRLMICAARTPAGELTATIVVGHVAVMDALRMSPQSAGVDTLRAEKLLTGRQPPQ